MQRSIPQTERSSTCIALQCVHPFSETPLGVGPCPLVGLALMRKRIRARVAFEPL